MPASGSRRKAFGFNERRRPGPWGRDRTSSARPRASHCIGAVPSFMMRFPGHQRDLAVSNRAKKALLLSTCHTRTVSTCLHVMWRGLKQLSLSLLPLCSSCESHSAPHPIVLVTPPPPTQGTSKPPRSEAAVDSHPFATYLGRWRIKSYERLSEPVLLDDAYAKSQLTKSIVLESRHASTDRDFLFRDGRTCQNPTYSWAPKEHFEGRWGWQGLLPDDHPLKREGEVRLLMVDCGGVGFISGELTKQGSLAIMYDGYYFFLERER
jgi:hypothetical protein